MKPGWPMVVIPTLLSSQLSPPNRVLPSLPQTIHKLLLSTNAEAGAVVGAIGEEGAAAVPGAVAQTQTPIPTTKIIRIIQTRTIRNRLLQVPTNLIRKAQSTVTFQTRLHGPVLSTGVKAEELPIAQILLSASGKTSSLLAVESLASLASVIMKIQNY